MSDTQAQVTTPASTSPSPVAVVSPQPKKNSAWRVILEVLGLVLGLVLAFFFGTKQASVPKKNFKKTNDPTVVKTAEGKLVELPETKTEGQVTDKTAVSVSVSPAVDLRPQEVTHASENSPIIPTNTVTGGPVSGSVGESLFGPPGNKS